MAEKDYQLLKDKSGYADKDMQERCVCGGGGGGGRGVHLSVHTPVFIVFMYVRMYSM